MADPSPIELSPSDLGATVEVTAFGLGDEDDPGSASKVATGESLRPPAPVHLQAEPAGGELAVSWVRRSRFGWAWVDLIDTPLGEGTERYRLQVQSAAGSVKMETAEPRATLSAVEIAALGSRPWDLSVVQLGDFAVSRESRLQLL